MLHQSKRAISVGGGKGGIGKSCFASNIAISLAQKGKRVILVDMDIEAPNLHTFVGINYPRRTLDDYLSSKVKGIQDIVLDTPIQRLQLISSAGGIMSLSGLKYPQRQKFFRSVMQLDTDIVIFDIAAGTNIRIIDYFSLAPIMVIMIEPIPTSLENAYMFLKNLMYRHLLRLFYTDKSTSQMIRDILGDKRAKAGQSLDELLKVLEYRGSERTDEFKKLIASFNIFLVLNKVHTVEQLEIINRFTRVVKRYLTLNLHYGGGLPYEAEMDASIIARTPFVSQFPNSPYAKAINDVLVNMLL